MSRSVCWAVRLAAGVFTAFPLRQRRSSGTTRPSRMQLARPRYGLTTTRNIPLDLSCAIRNAFPQKGAISELIDDHRFGRARQHGLSTWARSRSRAVLLMVGPT